MNACAKLMWCGAILAVSAGCAPREQAAAVTPTPPAPRAPVVRTPLPELPAVQIERQPVAASPRQLYSMEVQEQSIRDVLLALGRTTDLSFVIAPGVEGAVTVDLKQVTLEEMLDAMLTPIGLSFQREGNIVRVAKP